MPTDAPALLSPPCLRVVRDGLELDVVVQPRAARSRLVGLHDGRLKLQLAAPPVDGAANDALVELLADLCSMPRRDVTLERGDTSRRKTVALRGISMAAARDALGLGQ